MTPWVKRLLVANVLAFLLVQMAPAATLWFGFDPAQVLARPWTLLSYMFLHDRGFAHIFFNMLMLFFFGPRLEERLGSVTFIRFYLLCGVAGAVVSMVFFPIAPFGIMIGASGAVFGVVLGFARYWPREQIYVWGIFPVQARYLALFMVASSLFFGFAGARDGIAHFAHLGGLAAGWVFLRAWESRRKGRVKEKSSLSRPSRPSGKEVDLMTRWRGIPKERLHEVNREELEKLLAKIADQGVKTLTKAERDFLDRIANSV